MVFVVVFYFSLLFSIYGVLLLFIYCLLLFLACLSLLRTLLVV